MTDSKTGGIECTCDKCHRHFEDCECDIIPTRQGYADSEEIARALGEIEGSRSEFLSGLVKSGTSGMDLVEARHCNYRNPYWQKQISDKVREMCGLRYKLRYEYDEWVSETQGTLKEHKVSLIPTLYCKKGKPFEKTASTEPEAYIAILLWLAERKATND